MLWRCLTTVQSQVPEQNSRDLLHQAHGQESRGGPLLTLLVSVAAFAADDDLSLSLCSAASLLYVAQQVSGPLL